MTKKIKPQVPPAPLGLARCAVRSFPAMAAPADGMIKLLAQLRSATGHDFSHYKKSAVGRRIAQRMAQCGLADVDSYRLYLKGHPVEAHALSREMLISVTRFFRDAEAFAVLKRDILPRLCAGKPEDCTFHVWVAGCASGEEAYSIAMVLREFLDETRREFKLQLHATDLDAEAVATARAGCYPPDIAADVTPERLSRFFVADDAGYRVTREIRDLVVFATRNVITDAPLAKFDLVSCRNLMIYLEPDLQDRLIAVFHRALEPGGVLLLSPSESTGCHTDLFAALNRKWKFYRALNYRGS